ncbi:MAG TPA: AEC family transporter [Candidatus Polarisedimenticolaceae bacterium]|nr:AEC family transporter [Candidatus Polarisedimenticolaceae bacterium]
MLRLFTDILLPVIVAAGTGYWLAARFRLDVRSLSRVAFHLLAPCLVFQAILDSELPGTEMLRMAGLAISVLLVSAAIAGGVARGCGWHREQVAAVVLVVLLPNAGNFGLPTTLFAFGEEGLAQASIFFIAASLATFTIGVLVASSGRARPLAAARGLLRVPAVWAIALALSVSRSGWTLPHALGRPIELFSDASIPVFLLILGMQLRGNGFEARFGPVGWAVASRLLISPVVALVAAPLWGIDGVARQAAVLESAMPCAVISTVLAAEYDLAPRFVTTAVFASTLISPVTLTPLLDYLGA